MNYPDVTTQNHCFNGHKIFNQFFAQKSDQIYDVLGRSDFMNLGHVDPELEKFLNEYKKHGFATRTEMANEAFRFFKQFKARKSREKWRQDAFEELADLKPDRAFEKIDGEDFV